jgi:hypothetical protein
MDMNSPGFWTYMHWVDLSFAGPKFFGTCFNQDPKRSCLEVLSGLVTQVNRGEAKTIPATPTQVPHPPPACPIGGMDYFFDGDVGGSDGFYILTALIKDATTCEVVAQTSVSFTDTQKGLEAASVQAASQLAPVFDKIREFQKRKRDESKDTAIYANIEAKPAQEKIKVGESTAVTLFLYDCDNHHPLPHRSIKLRSSMGTIDPATVETDGSGHAIARFTAGNTAGLGTVNADYFYTSVTHKHTSAFGNATIQIGDAPSGVWRMDIDIVRREQEDGSGPVPSVPGAYWRQYERRNYDFRLTAFFKVNQTPNEIDGLQPLAVSGGGGYTMEQFWEEELSVAEGSLDLSPERLSRLGLGFDILTNDNTASVSINDASFRYSEHDRLPGPEGTVVERNSEGVQMLPPMAATSTITSDAKRAQSYKVVLDRKTDMTALPPNMQGYITETITATIRPLTLSKTPRSLR